MGRAHGRKQSTQESQQPVASEDQEATSQKKTTICEKWLWGLCEFSAADCAYAHGIRALSTSTQHKTTYCKAYFSKGGHCRSGNNCRFAHDSAELSCTQPKQKRAPQGPITTKAKDRGKRNMVSGPPEEPRHSVWQDGHSTTSKLPMPGYNKSLDSFKEAVLNAYHASVGKGLGCDAFKNSVCDQLHIHPVEFHSYQEDINACLESLNLGMPEYEQPSGRTSEWPHRVGRRHSEPATVESSEDTRDVAADGEENASKTVICKDWLWGKCELDAASCPFAHGIYALTTASKFKKTSYCKAFFSKAGHCRNGARCHFAHSSEELHTNAKALPGSVGRRHSDPSVLSHTSMSTSLPENMRSQIGVQVQASCQKSFPNNTNVALHHVVSDALQASIRGGEGLQGFWKRLGESLQIDAEELQVHRYEIGECLKDISMTASNNGEKENTNMLNHVQHVSKLGAWDLRAQNAKKLGGTPLQLIDANQCNTHSARGPGAQHDKMEKYGKACKAASYKRKVLQVLPCLLETEEEHTHLSGHGYVGA